MEVARVRRDESRIDYDVRDGMCRLARTQARHVVDRIAVLHSPRRASALPYQIARQVPRGVARLILHPDVIAAGPGDVGNNVIGDDIGPVSGTIDAGVAVVNR